MKIDILDKKGKDLFTLICYDKEVYKYMLKQFRRNKNLNVIERK